MFNNIFQQMSKAKESLQEMQNELAKIIVVGESGAGLVQITMNALGDALKVHIDESLYAETNKQVIADLITAAINDAKVKRERAKSDSMKSIMSKLGLPADFKLPFMDN